LGYNPIKKLILRKKRMDKMPIHPFFVCLWICKVLRGRLKSRYRSFFDENNFVFSFFTGNLLRKFPVKKEKTYFIGLRMSP
jgi:hypothetical protein